MKIEIERHIGDANLYSVWLREDQDSVPRLATVTKGPDERRQLAAQFRKAADELEEGLGDE